MGKETAGQDYSLDQNEHREPERKFHYLKCKGYYDALTERWTGCGRLFTTASQKQLMGVCPHCGQPLVKTAYDEPARRRYHIAFGLNDSAGKMLGIDCVKCANADKGQLCAGEENKRENCAVCFCAACCSKSKTFSRVLQQRVAKFGYNQVFAELRKEAGKSAGNTPMAKTLSELCG